VTIQSRFQPKAFLTIADDLFSKVLGGQAIEKAYTVAEHNRLQALAPEAGARALDLRLRRAVIVGVKGKLGEALLNQLLASSYLEVTAIADKPLTLGIAKLHLSQIHEVAEAQAQDAYLCLSDPLASYGKSYYGRDAHFSELLASDAFRVAQALVTQGVRRLILISPLSSWHQMSPSAKGISSELESQMLSLQLESFLILRPSAELQSAPQASLFGRFIAGYLGMFRMMLPKGSDNIRTEQLARSAIRANQYARSGVQVLNNQDLLSLAQATPK
jgi:hypothetical protein